MRARVHVWVCVCRCLHAFVCAVRACAVRVCVCVCGAVRCVWAALTCVELYPCSSSRYGESRGG